MERKILVLYGSQTGTAQDVAERIGREAKRIHMVTRVMAFDDFDISTLSSEPLVAFVCATTGQGDEPDNMRRSWRLLLRRSLPSNLLEDIAFGVLGLGDSSYPRFNFAAKRLHRRLLQLGGHAIVDPGNADDQHDLGADAVVHPWLEGFWRKVKEMWPLPDGVVAIPDEVISPPKWMAEFLDNMEAVNNKNLTGVDSTSVTDQNRVINQATDMNVMCTDKMAVTGPHAEMDTSSLKGTKEAPFYATLLQNIRVTHRDHFQDVRLVKLDIQGSGMTFEPGDVLMVQPQNLPENVTTFFDLFPQLNRDRHFRLRPADPNIHLPSNMRSTCTLHECASRYWDIQSVPRRYFFEVLSHFAEDELEKEKLSEFASSEGQDERYQYCNRPRRNILEVLHDFRDTASRVPFDYFFDLIPAIKPRAFSIASSIKAHPGEVHILVAVVQYNTKLHQPRLGLCSNWLSHLESGATVPVWIQKGTFKFNQDPSPTIMIGPGTGCAPFRAYIQHCVSLDLPSPNLVLFFGCRSQSKDHFFEEEWEPLVQDGRLRLFCAFSRDQEDKVYVQHKLREQADLVWHLIDTELASIYLAGNAKQMPQDVQEALVHVISNGGELSNEQALLYLNQMESRKRFQMETWS